MTNLLASVIVLLGTNTTQIGTFDSALGFGKFDVKQDRYVTNTIAIMEFEGHEKRFTLKSEEGPIIGERRELNPWADTITITNFSSIWFTNSLR